MGSEVKSDLWTYIEHDLVVYTLLPTDIFGVALLMPRSSHSP